MTTSDSGLAKEVAEGDKRAGLSKSRIRLLRPSLIPLSDPEKERENPKGKSEGKRPKGKENDGVILYTLFL